MAYGIALTIALCVSIWSLAESQAVIGVARTETPIEDKYPDQGIIRPQVVEYLRSRLMYPYNSDDYTEISGTTVQIMKQFSFQMPFFGFSFNYTKISLLGCLLFSEAPKRFQYPLKFPVDNWPDIEDPAFIGPFFSRANIGDEPNAAIKADRQPGVYVRIIPNIANDPKLRNRELREAIYWDIRGGMVGAMDFDPKHVVVVTWRNITFGGSANSERTNTFQLMLATDEIRTYAIFNYEKIVWMSSTEANGDSHTGAGGTPAFVGFNAGNGTRAFEYKPYSQNAKILSLTTMGGVNGHSGRHIFRIDEEILQGSCNFYPDLPQDMLKLVISPEAGHMLGGTIVNITGPCFTENEVIKAKFHDTEIECRFQNRNFATCVTPTVYSVGYVEISASVGTANILFKNKFYIENPMISSELVSFPNKQDLNGLVPIRNSGNIEIKWDSRNLTQNKADRVSINLFGYLESSGRPELVFIDYIEPQTANDGYHSFNPATLLDRDNGWKREFRFGLIQINLTQYKEMKFASQPVLWSRPIPLAWYFHKQWIRYYGTDWAVKFCKRWDQDDRRLKNFAYEVPRCPCTLSQALGDKGQFAPDIGCDKWGNNECYGTEKIFHCVRSGQPSQDGAGQQCCYGKNDFLVMNVDAKQGGIPSRSHPFGVYPYDESTKVPGLSHWYHDMAPYYYCCQWQDEMTEGCYQFKWRRASHDCLGYQPPTGASVFGDPHFITFDGAEYTFNGKGEYTLLTVNDQAHVINVQGRFEQLLDTRKKTKLRATQLTAVAMADNTSSVVEVQLRPREARWRYRLNVLVDQKRIYFDRPSQKIQSFKGVTIYTPGNVLNQSQIVVMFRTGAGVEVLDNGGYITARIYLPKSFMNITRGLMGNWSGDKTDDLVLPAHLNRPPLPSSSNQETIFKEFNKHWVITDSTDSGRPAEKSLFYHEYGRTSSHYYDANFKPELREPDIWSNATISESDVQSLCGPKEVSAGAQCRFDYIVTENREFAYYTKLSADTFRIIREDSLKTIKTCGALYTPRNGRKLSVEFTSGTTVTFECLKGYVIEGETSRRCEDTGVWTKTLYGHTRCILEEYYFASKAGITSGIVLGILVPCLIAGVCIFGCIISRGNSENASRSFTYNLRKQEEEIEIKPIGKSKKMETDA